MACIKPDGTLTASARKILTAMQSPATLQEVSEATGLPLYRVRSSAREIVKAGLVRQEHDQYMVTKAGQPFVEEG